MKLKIGELAEKANVTKRTIDYYTRLGLLNVERSASNYRYYSQSSIARIRLIEEHKKAGMSLEEIKKKIIESYYDEVDIQELRLRILGLEKDVKKAISKLEDNPVKYQEFKKGMSPESLSLIHALLVLLS